MDSGNIIYKNKCCVLNCNDRVSKRHRFPKNVDLLKKWVENIKEPRLRELHPEQIYSSFYVCNSVIDILHKSIWYQEQEGGCSHIVFIRLVNRCFKYLLNMLIVVDALLKCFLKKIMWRWWKVACYRKCLLHALVYSPVMMRGVTKLLIYRRRLQK
jgi:hypothetical protein